MEVRTAEPGDISDIVKLLKLSLGEGLMPKSEGYWRWKHIDNPFGASPVLVATEAGMLVGVRAFMRWTWKGPAGLRHAVRAVDTATHPDFQGKGIFSRLTRSLLELTAKDRVSFVFNTPNSKSMPGYLKMGWEKAGRLPLRIQVLRPMSVAANLFWRRKSTAVVPDNLEGLEKWLNNPGLDELIHGTAILQGANLVTDYSRSYLKWRYLEVPVASYFANGDDEKNLSALAIFRIKQSQLGRELRVCDAFVRSAKSKHVLSEVIFDTARRVHADYLITSGFTPFAKGLTFKAGPMVTIRKVSDAPVNDLKGFVSWRPVVGDLELF